MCECVCVLACKSIGESGCMLTQENFSKSEALRLLLRPFCGKMNLRWLVRKDLALQKLSTSTHCAL